MRVWALATSAALTLLGCGGAAGTGPDVGSDVPLSDAGVDGLVGDTPFELPTLNITCTDCHDIGALTRDAPTVGVHEWMMEHGEGLLRVDPALPISPAEKRLFFVRRGRHESTDPDGCGACHPVREDGIGHGVRTFPSVEAVFQGGVGCAPSCHSWLTGTVESRGFLDASGSRPTWKGVPSPEGLLSAVENGHSRLWREGARPDPAAFRISAFNAGCGGCHHLREESHGAMLGCLDCHRFSGGSHDRHLQVISATMATLDVEAVQGGLSPCAYCHVEEDPGMTRSGAVCYDCHLSGHQPVDATGRAHFWPVP